jgi:NADPH:quinone reductase-like Zn-dependent oxidoreductase
VNLLDSKIRSGEFKPILPYRAPFVLGHDVAGVVLRVGARITQFKPGDEVYARPADHRIGTFAERIAIRETDLALKPTKLTMEEAASIPLVGLTAWQALVEIGRLQAGQKVFVQAGSGGVGTFAIQLAKHLGAVVATTTSTSNVELVRGLGADVIVDYKKEDFEAKLSGYDLVVHSQDGAALEKSLRVLRPGGRLISISGPPDPEFARAIGAPWYVTLFTWLSSFGARRKAKSHDTTYAFLLMHASGDQLRQIAQLIDAGHVRPVVDKTFPFESTNEALAYVETGRARGKVVIKLR